jgi:hypothetical protein
MPGETSHLTLSLLLAFGLSDERSVSSILVSSFPWKEVFLSLTLVPLVTRKVEGGTIFVSQRRSLFSLLNEETLLSWKEETREAWKEETREASLLLAFGLSDVSSFLERSGKEGTSEAVIPSIK